MADSVDSGCSGAVTLSGATARGAVQSDARTTRSCCPTCSTSNEPSALRPTVLISPPVERATTGGVAVLTVLPLTVLSGGVLARDGTEVDRTGLDQAALDGTDAIALAELALDPAATGRAPAAQPAATGATSTSDPTTGIPHLCTWIIGTTRPVDASSPQSGSQPQGGVAPSDLHANRQLGAWQ